MCEKIDNEFIEKLVNANNKKGKDSLELLLNSLKEGIDCIFVGNNYSQFTIDELNLLKETIETILNEDLKRDVIKPFYCINNLKKAGLLIDVLFKNNLNKIEIIKARTMAVTLVNISRIIKNSELTKTSDDVLNTLKKAKRYDNEILVKDLEKSITPLKELILMHYK